MSEGKKQREERRREAAKWRVIKCKHASTLVTCVCVCVCVFVLQLVVVAYDGGEPQKQNTAVVEITVLQPSVIPVFTQEEYRCAPTHNAKDIPLSILSRHHAGYWYPAPDALLLANHYKEVQVNHIKMVFVMSGLMTP